MRLKLFYSSSKTFPYIIKFWTKLDLTKFPYYYLANYIYLTWFVCFCNIFRAKLNYFCSLYVLFQILEEYNLMQNLIWRLEFFENREKMATFTRFNLNWERSLTFNKFGGRKVWITKYTFQFILLVPWNKSEILFWKWRWGEEPPYHMLQVPNCPTSNMTARQ